MASFMNHALQSVVVPWAAVAPVGMTKDPVELDVLMPGPCTGLDTHSVEPQLGLGLQVRAVPVQLRVVD